MFKNLFLKTLRDQKVNIYLFSGGFIFISLYLAYFYPYMSGNSEIFKVLKTLPPFIKNFLGDMSALATPEGFFNLQPFMFFAPIIVLLFSAAKGAEMIAGEVEKGTIDVLLSRPQTRTQILNQKSSAIIFSLFLISAVFFISFQISLKIFGIDISVYKIFSAIFSLFLFSLTFYSFSLFLSTIFLKKKPVFWITGVVASLSLIFNSYSSAVKSLRTIAKFTPSYYYNSNSPLSNGLDLKMVMVQISIFIIFYFLSIIVFRKRDLYG